MSGNVSAPDTNRRHVLSLKLRTSKNIGRCVSNHPTMPSFHSQKDRDEIFASLPYFSKFWLGGWGVWTVSSTFPSVTAICSSNRCDGCSCQKLEIPVDISLKQSSIVCLFISAKEYAERNLLSQLRPQMIPCADSILPRSEIRGLQSCFLVSVCFCV